ncbi:class I SAM-dependent methyltransferase [Trichocoleus sp. DQ-A3]|uniref:class I SAM-dependent methyltransferase n=2 Tax=Cyanobacteriota TaxID=1117 RepID=UPI0030DC48C6
MKENNSKDTPLHAMNPLSRFSNRAEDYAKYRPNYPDAAIDIILKGLGNPSQLVAADIGAGTGISSRLLAQRGVNAIAIEPNAAMREAASPHSLVEFRDGTAEVTNLPNASVDLVTCFQSFHWFNPEPTLLEFRRILRPRGRLAVVWNDRDQNDQFTANYSRLVEIASNNHPAEKRMVSATPLLTSPHFPDVHSHSFEYWQQLDLEGLIGRVNSVSYIPKEGSAYEQLVADLQELYASACNERGYVYLTYTTNVYLADNG